jgi:MFS family permease
MWRPNFGGLWRDRRFLTFWSAQTVSEFGDRITELALPLIAAILLNATPEEVGMLTAAVWLPNLISLFIGSWVDQRPDKRRLMVTADLTRVVVLLSLPVAFWLGLMTLPQLYAVAILAGTAHIFFNTAYASFFVRLVAPEHYLEANSKLSATRSISQMGGPALAGLLIQFLSAPVAILADALSFAFSAVQVARLKSVPAHAPTTEETVLQRARAGMRYLLGHTYLRDIILCAAHLNIFMFMASAVLIYFASRNLGLSAGAIGLALGIGASGGLLGAIYAGRLTRIFGAGIVVAVASVVFPGALAMIAFADGPSLLRATLLGVSEFISAFAVMCFDVPLGAIQASVTDHAMRSRVSGAQMTINYGVRPFGALIGGLLGGWIGPRETLLVSAIGGALCVFWLLRSPVLKVSTIESLQKDFRPGE